MSEMTYLDHNATTPLRPSAIEAMSTAMAIVGNASSVHRFGRSARRTIEDARDAVAALVSAAPADVVFTSGGTEANMLALRGTGRPQAVVSAAEHVAVLHAVECPLSIPVDDDGVVRLDALDEILSRTDSPAIVSVMLANNETGVIQPVAEAAEIAHRHGALMHCDAVQAAAKLPIDVQGLNVDLLSLSAHKMGGPSGVGALIVRNGVHLAATQRGGGQERGRRGGTENAIGIAGFGAAARDCVEDRSAWTSVMEWRGALEERAQRAVPSAQVIGSNASRLPNTSCIAVPGIDSEIQVMALDLGGVAVSAGSACSSGKVSQSHVLAAMGIPDAVARSAIRISLGWSSTDRDIERFLEVWAAFVRETGSETDGGRCKAA